MGGSPGRERQAAGTQGRADRRGATAGAQRKIARNPELGVALNHIGDCNLEIYIHHKPALRPTIQPATNVVGRTLPGRAFLHISRLTSAPPLRGAFSLLDYLGCHRFGEGIGGASHAAWGRQS
jgi:hypothetical protein